MDAIKNTFIIILVFLLFFSVYDRNKYAKQAILEHQQNVQTLKWNVDLTRMLRKEQHASHTARKVLYDVADILAELPLVSPLIDTNMVISSHFGVFRGNRIHKGIDIPLPEGSPLYATCTGTLTVGKDSIAGYIARIMTLDSMYMHKFFHLKSMPIVGLSDTVYQREFFAISGNTGRSTGPHLHYEVLKRDSTGKYIHQNPETLRKIYNHKRLHRIRERIQLTIKN